MAENRTAEELLRYVEGDATRPEGDGLRIIAHICNDIGGWGAGFVRALSARWSAPEEAYRSWWKNRATQDFRLGSVQIVPVEEGLHVMNMIGQHGIRKLGTSQPPIRYEAVEECLQHLGEHAAVIGASVHMPRIGCGLAGGKWERIEPLIRQELTGRGVPVTVYDPPSLR